MFRSVGNRCNKLFGRLPTVYRGALIAGIPVIAILPAIASWNWSRQAKNDAFWWVNHTQEVIRESNNLMRVLVNAETGIRGYIITQQPEFLEPYNRGTVEGYLYLKKLKELTKDNSSQQQHLITIEQQIITKFDTLKSILNNLELSQPNEKSTASNKLFIRGKAEMDLLRNSINQFKDEEWKLLNIRQKRLDRIKKTTDLLLNLSIFLSLVGYSLAIALYYMSQKQLQRKVKQLDRINQDLKDSNQLIQKRNQELDSFTYIVSHDLKAPLRAINNLSEWIEEDLGSDLDEDTSQNLSLLRSRVQRMNNFIDSLLQYSRAGRIKGKIETVNLNQLLEEVIDSIAPPPEFAIAIQEPIPLLKTDSLSLQQVLTNLISNGVKHHHRQDGKVTISVVENGDISQFCIADDGQGIAPEHQEKIFTIFQTLTSRDKQENTGIGLSIVKKIVEERGGKIWLESELNHGTSFYFTWQT